MWDTSSAGSRARALARKRKKEAMERNHRHDPVHLMRTTAELVIRSPLNEGNSQKSAVIPARLVLNDITPHSVAVFTPEPLESQQEVELRVEKPKPVNISTIVASCQHVLMNHRVISEQSFPYRVWLLFDPENEEQMKMISALVTPQQN